MQVDLDDLQRAFRLAHRAAESPLYPEPACQTFRAIAFILWRMAGTHNIREEVTCTDASTN